MNETGVTGQCWSLLGYNDWYISESLAFVEIFFYEIFNCVDPHSARIPCIIIELVNFAWCLKKIFFFSAQFAEMSFRDFTGQSSCPGAAYMCLSFFATVLELIP